MKLPEWLLIAAPKSRISVKEISRVLGISENLVHVRVCIGKFPEYERGLKSASHNRKYWRADTIRNFLRELP